MGGCVRGWALQTLPFEPRISPIQPSPNLSISHSLNAGSRASLAGNSAFFTSVWLWLYAASVLLSRVLLRMNKGVGFLLRVTDVEEQPFRSMGFVSVIITSVLFALGLPLVLL